MRPPYFEDKSGILITPYEESMIDGSESSNACKSSDSGVGINETGGNICFR